ncbi:MAG: hypothetical protein DI626_02820 [Micavibrio aeruginosavorus]|uniref:Lipoprotein n=1 Tax=Micavibrio aeruginosavorus TaxID=349221 RepID=A0A2W5A056_9BACT|nr:MAG: hypothetical protein DI626_02820 [Micavibrio aeruginosavorus]
MSFKKTLILPLLLLAGCGTLIKGQTQDITFIATGVDEAECTIDNGVKYKIKNGETLSIMRSEHDMKVDCYGAGNRHKSFVIPRELNGWSAANVANGVVPGVTYDHFSNGLYEYPEKFTVDFSGPAPGYGLPEYHDLSYPNPYDQKIEDYTPGTLRIENDSVYQKREINRTGMGMEGNNPFSRAPMGSPDITSMPPASTGATGAQGGHLSNPNGAWSPAPITPQVPRGGNSESLTRAMNPTVFGGNQ